MPISSVTSSTAGIALGAQVCSNGQDGSKKRCHPSFVITTNEGGISCSQTGVLLMCEALGRDNRRTRNRGALGAVREPKLPISDFVAQSSHGIARNIQSKPNPRLSYRAIYDKYDSPSHSVVHGNK